MSEVLVLKLGGTTLADQQQVLAEVAAVARRRPVVVVHGGGKRMTEWLDRLGVPTRFEGGLRVTDAQALEVAAAVLRGVVNSELVAALRDLRRRRGRPVGRRRRPPRRRARARAWASSPTSSASSATSSTRCSSAGQVPVVAPLARDEDGHRLQRQRRRRGGGARGRARRPPARPDDRRRRDPRRRRDEDRDADGRRGRGAHRAPARSRAGWSPRSGPRWPGSRRPAPRPSSATRPRPDALARALDDPTFGTRITPAAAARPGAAGPPCRRPAARHDGTARTAVGRRARRRTILDLVAARAIGSQEELAGAAARARLRRSPRPPSAATSPTSGS